jgi:outer membrane immunogenic protein
MCTLKRFLLASSIVLGFASAASAQSDWHGFYVGGNIGGAIHRSTADTMSSFSQSGYLAASSVNALTIAGRQRLNNDSSTGGVEVGFNKQSENTVFGIETDYVALRMNVSRSNSVDYTCPLCSGTNFTVSQLLKTRWLYTLRPRFGIATGRMLYFVTGGLALTKLNYQETFSDNFASANGNGEFNKTKAGWTAGLGASFRLNPERWSVKGEYLYTAFGRSTITSSNLSAFIPPVAFPANVFNHSVALHSHILRGGVDYRW